MHSMAELEQRELNMIELLGMGKNFYQAHWRQMLQLVLWIGLPIQLVMQLVGLMVGTQLAALDLKAIATDPAVAEAFLASGQWVQIVGNYLVLVILSAILYPLLLLAVATYVDHMLRATPITAGAAIRIMLQRAWVVVPAALIYECMVGAGLVALILPGLYVMVRLFFYLYAILLDDKGVFGCFQRSCQLTKGFFWKTAMGALLLMGLSYTGTYVLDLLFGVFGYSYSVNVLFGLCNMALDAFFAVVTTLYYLNRAAVLEGDLPRQPGLF